MIFVVKSLKYLGLNNVGPESQTMAQHYSTTGPMYRVIWVVAFLATWEESVTRIAIAAVLVCVAKQAYVWRMLGYCWAIVRHVGSTLKKHWLAVQWLP